MSDLSGWTKRPAPGASVLRGERVQLEPFEANRHAAGVFASVGGPANAAIWTWMPVGPWESARALQDFLADAHASEGWRTMVIRKARGEGDASGAGEGGEILGMASYMRIRQAHGSAEIGCVAFGPKLSRTREATEALSLMAAHVFDDLGYRRYEWKCNAANAASKRAAERFGFAYEGLFRNDMVMKGASRDTAWYSIIDTEWPALREALAQWLAHDNFAPDGAQLRTLESFRRGA